VRRTRQRETTKVLQHEAKVAASYLHLWAGRDQGVQARKVVIGHIWPEVMLDVMIEVEG
jgi:hypothetical protein